MPIFLRPEAGTLTGFHCRCFFIKTNQRLMRLVYVKELYMLANGSCSLNTISRHIFRNWPPQQNTEVHMLPEVLLHGGLHLWNDGLQVVNSGMVDIAGLGLNVLSVEKFRGFRFGDEGTTSPLTRTPLTPACFQSSSRWPSWCGLQPHLGSRSTRWSYGWPLVPGWPPWLAVSFMYHALYSSMRGNICCKMK